MIATRSLSQRRDFYSKVAQGTTAFFNPLSTVTKFLLQ